MNALISPSVIRSSILFLPELRMNSLVPVSLIVILIVLLILSFLMCNEFFVYRVFTIFLVYTLSFIAIMAV